MIARDPSVQTPAAACYGRGFECSDLAWWMSSSTKANQGFRHRYRGLSQCHSALVSSSRFVLKGRAEMGYRDQYLRVDRGAESSSLPEVICGHFEREVSLSPCLPFRALGVGVGCRLSFGEPIAGCCGSRRLWLAVGFCLVGLLWPVATRR